MKSLIDEQQSAGEHEAVRNGINAERDIPLNPPSKGDFKNATAKRLFALALFVSIILPIMPSHFMSAYAQNPQPLRPDIDVNKFLTVENNCVRIDYDYSSGKLYYVRISGEIYSIDLAGPSKALISTANDHGISSAAGFAIASDGTFFLVGNLTQTGNNNVGIIKKGEIENGSQTWTTVAQTVPYPLNIQFNHNFNAVAISPDEQYLFVNSGARTDHGEDQRGDGNREFPLTTAIFRLPIDGQNIILENDEAFLVGNGYQLARGVRNHFDLAFAPNGDLFGVENSGDRDDSEEMNWIREGRHYGFPWRLGTNDTPQQFPGYDPGADPLVSPNSFAYSLGFFHDDSTYPPPPDGIEFTDPIPSTGPDADRFRESDGTAKDASEEGISISTFTAHRVPLGLVFDHDKALSDEFAGDAFVLGFGTGSNALGDPGNDLLHLDLEKNEVEQRYEVTVTRLVENFSGGRFDRGPVDAALVGNKLYVLETGAPNLWEITLPAKSTSVASEGNIPENFSLSQNYPNPFNPSTVISFQLPVSSEVWLVIFSITGRLVRTLLKGQNASGTHSVVWDATDDNGTQVASGVYVYRIQAGRFTAQKKLLLVR